MTKERIEFLKKCHLPFESLDDEEDEEDEEEEDREEDFRGKSSTSILASLCRKRSRLDYEEF